MSGRKSKDKRTAPKHASQSILGMFKRQAEIQKRILQLEEKDKGKKGLHLSKIQDAPVHVSTIQDDHSQHSSHLSSLNSKDKQSVQFHSKLKRKKISSSGEEDSERPSCRNKKPADRDDSHKEDMLQFSNEGDKTKGFQSKLKRRKSSKSDERLKNGMEIEYSEESIIIDLSKNKSIPIICASKTSEDQSKNVSQQIGENFSCDNYVEKEIIDIKLSSKQKETEKDKAFPASNHDQHSSIEISANNTSDADEVEEREGGKEGEFGEDKLPSTPYYLENFLLILNSILNDEFYKHLFNEDDHAAVDVFHGLSEAAQKLYVRLFGRKFRWIREEKIAYPKIAEDLTEFLRELVDSGLVEDESQLRCLPTVLQTLTAPDLRDLAKTLRLPMASQRTSLEAAIVRHCKQTHLSGFFQKQSDLDAVVLKRAKNVLGRCFHLNGTQRAVFIRCITLFALHQTTGEEDETGGGQQQLFQILMTNIGRIVYPTYELLRERQIFPTREAFIRFEAALQLEADIRGALEANDFDTAMLLYEKCKPLHEANWKDKEALNHDQSLPEHLRGYTAGSVYIRILSVAVEVLQKLRRYQEAVDLLRDLMKQTTYQAYYRGRWTERLALNLDQHLKKPVQALDIIRSGLEDGNVRQSYRLSLYQRACRLCAPLGGKKKKSLASRWEEFKDSPLGLVQDAPKVYIEGRLLHHADPSLGVSRVYVSCESEGGEMKMMTRVEDVALQHYASQGYPQGVHGEGGTFATLFSLFFWDIIFMSGIPDVFLSKYQSFPLDLYTVNFYRHRQEASHQRLAQLRESSVEDLKDLLVAAWEHEGTLCLGLNWERFTSLEHAQSLVACIGGNILAGIFERALQNRSHPWGGVPDLVVWNTENQTFRIVEVKGPGDRLSTKQIIWLDFLLRLGVEAEVCHVQAVGAKRLQPTKKNSAAVPD